MGDGEQRGRDQTIGDGEMVLQLLFLIFKDKANQTILPNVIDATDSKEARQKCWLNTIFLELFPDVSQSNNMFLPHE